MKVLIDHGIPFGLAHGGLQTHIEQTRRGLEAIGLEVEWVRWWDDSQTGDVIHAFAPVSVAQMRFAAGKGIPTVLTTLLDFVSNEPALTAAVRGWAYRTAERVPYLRGFFLNSDQLACRHATYNVVSLPSQAQAMHHIYGVPEERIGVVPLALPEVFHHIPPASLNGEYLVTASTITQRKRSVELARLAKAARVPVLFVGRPWASEDPYWKEFAALIDDQYVRYDDRCKTDADLIDRFLGARGFVFFSRYESWSLATHEAAACGLPLLLPAVSWVHDRFAGQATLWDRAGEDNVFLLRNFFEKAPTLARPQIENLRWVDVARQLHEIYARLVSSAGAVVDAPVPV